MKAIKTLNSSVFWTDFEGELSTYFYIKWSEETKINEFISNEVSFFTKYISICTKFGFAIPLNCNENNLIDLYQREKEKNKGYGKSAWYFLFSMYTYEKELVYTSKLFIDVNDKSITNIINIDPISELRNLENDNICFAPPLKVELRETLDEITLSCFLDNDIFNLEIDNKKTKRDPEIGGKDCWVDNSELAYLNTPRLNSFLRDLKKLCFEFGADTFEFENLGLNDFCEDGVQFNGEVVYYEDIEDMLEPHQRIENF